MADRQFDISKLSVTALTPAPVDITAGLTLESDFLTFEKENKEEIKARRGTRDETYSAIMGEDKRQKLMLKYLPSSPNVPILQAMRAAKTPFGLLIKNQSSPKWTVTASRAEFMEAPKTTISSKDGFADYEFMIRLLDAVEVFEPEI